jgi:glutathione S-transferase
MSCQKLSMKLYYCTAYLSLSPLIVPKELGLSHQLIKVDNQTKRTADGYDFRAINPKGYVAALELDNGEVLTEGPAIIQYLADLRPKCNWRRRQNWPRVRRNAEFHHQRDSRRRGAAVRQRAA